MLVESEAFVDEILTFRFGRLTKMKDNYRGRRIVIEDMSRETIGRYTGNRIVDIQMGYFIE